MASRQLVRAYIALGANLGDAADTLSAVSYTHLTLPTILLV